MERGHVLRSSALKYITIIVDAVARGYPASEDMDFLRNVQDFDSFEKSVEKAIMEDDFFLDTLSIECFKIGLWDQWKVLSNSSVLIHPETPSGVVWHSNSFSDSD